MFVICFFLIKEFTPMFYEVLINRPFIYGERNCLSARKMCCKFVLWCREKSHTLVYFSENV